MPVIRCLECHEAIDSTKKTCPNCGAKVQQKRTVGTLTKIVYTLGSLSLLLIGAMLFTDIVYREENLLKELSGLKENDFEGKYKTYKNLYGKDETNPDYKQKLVTYGEIYLKTVPAIEPEKNLEIYRLLNQVKPSKVYEQKIAFYSQMKSFITSCHLEALNKTRELANIPSTYNSGLYFGELKKTDYYLVVQRFSAKNAFGVEFEKQAVYSCLLNYKNNTFSLNPLRVEDQ